MRAGRRCDGFREVRGEVDMGMEMAQEVKGEVEMGIEMAQVRGVGSC